MKELEDYKGQHGNCNVPSIFPPNQALANWVRNQRSKFNSIGSNGRKSTSIEREEFNELKKIGFTWSVSSRAEKTLMYELTVDRVQAFKNKHHALWRTGDFNHDCSNLPSDFEDLTTLCEEIQDLKISKGRKKVLKRLRVLLPGSIGKEIQERNDPLQDDSIGDIIRKEREKENHISFGEIVGKEIGKEHRDKGDTCEETDEGMKTTNLCRVTRKKVRFQEEIPKKVRRSTRSKKK